MLLLLFFSCFNFPQNINYSSLLSQYPQNLTTKHPKPIDPYPAYKQHCNILIYMSYINPSNTAYKKNQNKKQNKTETKTPNQTFLFLYFYIFSKMHFFSFYIFSKMHFFIFTFFQKSIFSFFAFFKNAFPH
eukprot:UN02387